MYYAILVTSTLFTAGQFIFLKLYQRAQGSTASGALIFSSFAGFFQMIFSFIINGFKVNFQPFSLIMAALFSCCVIACNTFGIKVMQLGKISVYTLFMMLGGMIVPFFYGVIFLDEALKLPYIIAIVLLIVSLAVPAFEKSADGKKTSKLFYPLCCVLFFINGAVSTVSKAHQVDSRAVSTVDFLFLIGFTEFLISFILAFIIGKGETPFTVAKKKKPLLCGFGFASINIVGSFLQLYSAKEVNASVLYPIVTGGTIIFSAVFALIFFKEKINKYTLGSIAVAFLATLLFMF